MKNDKKLIINGVETTPLPKKKAELSIEEIDQLILAKQKELAKKDDMLK